MRRTILIKIVSECGERMCIQENKRCRIVWNWKKVLKWVDDEAVHWGLWLFYRHPPLNTSQLHQRLYWVVHPSFVYNSANCSISVSSLLTSDGSPVRPSGAWPNDVRSHPGCHARRNILPCAVVWSSRDQTPEIKRVRKRISFTKTPFRLRPISCLIGSWAKL